MLSWLKFFKRAPTTTDYETLLSHLSTLIKERETHLLSIKLRERRSNALAITYGTAFWGVYLILWYFGVLGGTAGLERVVGGIPVIGGPVAILFTSRILRWWYRSIQEKEETSLRSLKKQQRDQVEELKAKTGYYSTRNLLEKYDEAIKKNAEVRGLPAGQGSAGPSKPTPNGTPLRQTPQGFPPRPTSSNSNSAFSTPSRAGAGSGIPQSQAQQQQAADQRALTFPLLPPAPSTPVKRTLIDKLADALLGVAGEEASPNSRYALICAKCFAHNGLVVKEEFDTIQYQCPRCGHFNPARAPDPSRSTLGVRSGSPNGKPRSISMSVPSSTFTSTSSSAQRKKASEHHRRVKSLHHVEALRADENDDDEEEDESAEASSPGMVEGEEDSMEEKRDGLIRQKEEAERLRRRKKGKSTRAVDSEEMDTT